jgi:2-dehydropantoate 2-reductase
MRFAVFGAGAVGGYFGARLAHSQNEVVFIARGEHLQVMRTRGLLIESIKGDLQLPSVKVTDNPETVGEADVVLVAVKTWQLHEAAQKMKPLCGSRTLVLPLLNGVEAPDQLGNAVGFKHVLAGLAKIIAYKAGPGHIRHIGAEPHIAFGKLDNRASQRCRDLLRAFEEAGISAEIPPDIYSALWSKFLIVAAWGGVGAVTRAPVGVIRKLPQTRNMLIQAMEEIAEVAQARSIHLPQTIVTKTLSFIDALPSNNTTSLQRDLAEGRPSELDAWNGAVVRLARQVVVATPLNEFIYGSLLPLELRSRKELAFDETPAL